VPFCFCICASGVGEKRGADLPECGDEGQLDLVSFTCRSSLPCPPPLKPQFLAGERGKGVTGILRNVKSVKKTLVKHLLSFLLQVSTRTKPPADCLNTDHAQAGNHAGGEREGGGRGSLPKPQHAHARTLARAPEGMHAHAHARTRMHTRARTHAHVGTRTNSHTHAHEPTHAHAQAHARKQTRTRTRTHAPASPQHPHLHPHPHPHTQAPV
jgi:hypothetical protein